MNNIDFAMQEFAWDTTVGRAVGMTFEEMCVLNRKYHLTKQIVARLEATGKLPKKDIPKSLSDTLYTL